MAKLRDREDISWMWGVKGIAILCIVLYHWFTFFQSGVLSTIIKTGAQGAHTFFILSAFGLYWSLIKRNRTIDQKWFIKRFLKVLLPFYMAVLVVVLSICCYGLLIANVPLALRQFDLNVQSFLATILLYRNFSDRYMFVINTAWWFAITILEFYLLFPWLCLIYRRTPREMFLAAAFIINLLYEYFYAVALNSDSVVWSKIFPAFIFEFSVGIYLADLYIHNPQRFDRLTKGPWALLAGLILRAFGAWLALQGKVGYAFNNCFTAIGFSLIAYNFYAFVSQNQNIKAAFDWVGRNAFSMFLLHESYIVIIFNLLHGTHPSGLALFATLVTYLCLIVLISYLFQKFLIDQNPILNSSYREN